jgi:hypothetical protein
MLYLICGMPMAPALLWLLIAAFPRWMQLSRRMRICAATFPIILASIALTDWPLRLNLALHKPWLNKVADQVQVNGTIEQPGFIGLMRYRRVELTPEGSIGFQLTGGPGGGVHLVRAAPNASRVWFNTNWETSLGDNWYLAYED